MFENPLFSKMKTHLTNLKEKYVDPFKIHYIDPIDFEKLKLVSRELYQQIKLQLDPNSTKDNLKDLKKKLDKEKKPD